MAWQLWALRAHLAKVDDCSGAEFCERRGERGEPQGQEPGCRLRRGSLGAGGWRRRARALRGRVLSERQREKASTEASGGACSRRRRRMMLLLLRLILARLLFVGVAGVGGVGGAGRRRRSRGGAAIELGSAAPHCLDQLRRLGNAARGDATQRLRRRSAPHSARCRRLGARASRRAGGARLSRPARARLCRPLSTARRGPSQLAAPARLAAPRVCTALAPLRLACRVRVSALRRHGVLPRGPGGRRHQHGRHPVRQPPCLRVVCAGDAATKPVSAFSLLC